MKTTTNYALKKPDGTDLVNIEDINANMDTVDAQLKTAANHAVDAAKHITTVATTTANGLMAATDKVKLNGVVAGANNTTIANNLTTTAAGSALDATQGKALNDKIATLQRVEMYVGIEGDDAEGITVTATNGSTVVTGVTDANGKCVLRAAALGTYAITYSVEVDGTVQVVANSYGLYSISGSTYSMGVGYLMLYDGSLGDPELNECKDVTGGWAGTNTDATTLIKNNNYIHLDHGGAGVGGLILHTLRSIDLTPYDSACILADWVANASWSIGLIRITSQLSAMGDYALAQVRSEGISSAAKIVTLDISDVNATGYVEMRSNSSVTWIDTYNMLLLKPNNWKTWLTKANLNPVSYTSLDVVVNNASAMQTLANSKAAVDYMIRCTGTIMGAVTNSTVAMTALDANIYAISAMFKNEHWYKFMMMSPVALEVLDVTAVTIPLMTSSTTPSGRASASSESAGHEAYRCLDGNSGTYWETIVGANLNQWIQYSYNAPVFNYKVAISQGNIVNVIKNIKIQHSDDGINYTDATEAITYQNNKDVQTFILSKNRGKHRYWRLFVINGYTTGSGVGTHVIKVQFYGKELLK